MELGAVLLGVIGVVLGLGMCILATDAILYNAHYEKGSSRTVRFGKYVVKYGTLVRWIKTL